MVIDTDHKPLETILWKTTACPSSLPPTNDYVHPEVPHQCNLQARIVDTLSRIPLPDRADELELKQYDVTFLHTVLGTEQKLEELKKQTKEDSTLCNPIHTVPNKWPENKADTPPGAQPYDEVTHHHGIQKVIVPTSIYAP